MSGTPMHSVSVAGVVVDLRGRILLIQRRDNQHWEPPGGVLELGETFDEGVRREVLEETGITVDVERLTGAYKNLPRGIVALVFRCRPVDGEPVATDESVSVQWVDPQEALVRMAPAYAVRVADALGDHAEFRAHDGVNVLS
ncbi:NUDIX hydrolase [Kutzneria kofuensis]|uniref:8-oxo-dGTP pyrophosphatase MutT (NUDIX family) n=1 Tax=Kutzneria kofuensis TaxID=103725 RepID=A0A7W9NES9_9PSEU|nr:NUDIX domain-containing protein [Kutzneria kofuensis]MBB5890662.1 8-oxo-dGTP pyrophosphatase MutT (NUDIX family) [Kutzneria kofuensis]